MNIVFIVKTILEGLAVAIAAFFIPRRQMKIENIIAIALSAAAVFLILDQFSPEIGVGARQGAGFGIGLNQVGWGRPNDEPFEDCKFICQFNPGKCLTAGHICNEQYGGHDDPCDLQHIIDVGTDVQNRPVKYGTHCTDYFVDNVSNKPKCLPPYDVKLLQEPYGTRGSQPNWSQTNTMGRKMNFDESGCPVNKNTNEYKLIPGLYSKYALQPGYNENVIAFNSHTRFQDSNWSTNNPLDFAHFKPESLNLESMDHY